jgi:hypothetical protein
MAKHLLRVNYPATPQTFVPQIGDNVDVRTTGKFQFSLRIARIGSTLVARRAGK